MLKANALKRFVALGGLLVAGSFGLGSSAKAAVAILDQIGSTSAGVGTNVYTSDAFEAAFAPYDIAAGDDFTVPAATSKITVVQAVIGGFNGYTDYTSITGYGVEIYSSEAAAGSSLKGDVFSESLTPAQVSVNTTFASASEALVSFPVEFTLAPGTYYLAVIAANNFTNSGEAGIFGSATTTGGLNAFQANPQGGFGFGATQTITPATDLAYRVYATSAVPEPSTYALVGLSIMGGLCLRRRLVLA